MLETRDENSQHWLFKIALALLVLAWIFWAGQPSFELKLVSNEEYNAKQATEKQMIAFVQPIQSRAYKLDKKYSPKQFYSDLRELELMNEKLKHPVYGGCQGGQSICNNTEKFLSDMIMRNTQFNIDSRNEQYEEMMKYGKWKEKNIPPAPNLFENWTASSVWHWIWVFYLRSILLALFTFLIRMMRRDGLKAIICKYPLRSLVAPILWPIYWGTFPYNLYREWKVEAQIRRLGPLLRDLTVKEIKEVRRVAALEKAEYNFWQKRYNSSHKFRHSLVVALVATILLSLFAVCMASPNSFGSQAGKHGTTISARGDPVLDAGSSSSGISFEGMLPFEEKPKELVLLWTIPPEQGTLQQRQNNIEHVPYFGWLVARFITASQSAGAKNLRHKRRKYNAERNSYVSNRGSNRAALCLSWGQQPRQRYERPYTYADELCKGLL